MLAYVIAYKQAKGAGEVEIKLKKQAQSILTASMQTPAKNFIRRLSSFPDWKGISSGWKGHKTDTVTRSPITEYYLNGKGAV